MMVERSVFSVSALCVEIYDAIFSRWGPQKWWPGESVFEIVVGAILTQNTAWENVEKAIANLKNSELLDPESLRSLDPSLLAELIKPAGYFNVKAGRLRNFTEYLQANHSGDLSRMFAGDTAELRDDLLGVNGIGPETADSILLYGDARLVFVVDAYTRRFLKRHDWIAGDESYDDIARLFTDNLPPDPQLFNEYHALIVRLGKEHCRKKPKCDQCPLSGFPILADGSEFGQE